MSNHAEQILHQVRRMRNEFVAFVRELALLESPSLDPATQQPVQEMLEKELRACGFDVRSIPGRRTGGQLFARPQDQITRGDSQLVLGHTDTVWPAGTLQRMPVELEAGRLQGPGVFDMKAGLAQIVFALRTLHALQLTPTVTPLIFINSDEEIGSPESRPYIEEIAHSVSRALVLEPALGLSGKLKTARKGVGHFEIEVRGRAAHAGLEPERGVSAILELSYLVQKLFALNDAERGITVNVGTIDGGVRSNVIAPESKATVDVRVLASEDAEKIDRAIRSLQPTVDGASIEIRGGVDRGPMERTPRNQALWRAAQRLGKEIGLALEEGTSGGASDGNYTSYHTATLDGLGPVGDGAHAYHEFIEIEKTVDRCALLALLLLEPPIPVSE